ncbi:hypothetical protein [Acinetobacter nosocomialis]|uniref:hypothetical protein n=1 Tax=Acinetobacter nosocomialis TaxID=106654 RepID=UPI002810748B|nr:hypothetical protein [Acinetobacter nosocomialis]MDQ9030605.1 hypothetical protein [Acinetobacter nosocomialis]MDQ9048014.1 hypothetical protein [Acinetobacter nosocomialis]MDQ9085292.1 hypothetical protein [Acinetobacter nosocomialis]
MFEQILKHRPKGATHWQAGYYYNSDECGIWSIWENGKWHGDFKFPDGVMTKLPEEKEPAMSEFKEKVFLDWYLKESHLGFEPIDHARAAWQHQQAKVEEMEKQLSEYIFVAETLDEMYVKEVKSSEELQKRVDAVEQVINKIRNGNYANDHGEGVAKFIAAMLEQALKGKG